MTAPNTGAANAGAAPSNTPGAPGAERVAAHAGGPSLSDRLGVLEGKYNGKVEGTHSLDRSSFTVAIVLGDGTRIAGSGDSQEAAVSALETRLDRIGAAFA